MRGALLLLLVVLCGALAGVAWAEDDEEHGPPGVIAQELRASVHAGLSCTACHGEPMHGGNPTASCATCHQNEAILHRADVHAREGGPSCVRCHGSHAVKSRSDPSSSTHVANVSASCGACHETTFRAHARGPHGTGLASGRGAASATCTSCHGAHGISAATATFSAVVTSRCATCHEAAADGWAMGAHASARSQGDLRAPTCVGCHDPHAVPSARDPHSPTHPLALSRAVCGRCHSDGADGGPRSPGIDFLADYDASFHGLSARLGDSRAANCASCHRSHMVLPSSDPRSSTSGANLAMTCGACHAGAK